MTPSNQKSAGQTSDPYWPLFALAGLSVAFNPLNATMIAVALPSIGETFGRDPATLTTWLVNGFLLTTVVCLAPAGKLADIWGHGRVLFAGQIVLLAGTVISCLAPSFAFVVVGRLLMAVATAMLHPTGMALVRNNMPIDRQPRAFGMLGAATSAAATAGPAVAGFMTDLWGWRTIFLVNLVLIALSWLCWRLDRRMDRGSVATDGPRRQFDWQGSLLLMASLLLLVSAMRLLDTSSVLLLAGGLAISALFVVRERRAREPVVDFSLFRRAGFAAGIAVLAAQFFGMYGLNFLSPFMLRLASGFGPVEVGIALMIFSAVIIICSPIAGRAAERIGARPLVIAGGLVGAAGIVLINTEAVWGSLVAVAAAFAVAGVGYGLSVGPAQAATLSVVGPHESAAAAAAMSTLRYIGGVAGIATLSALLADAPAGDVLDRHRLALWLFAGAFALSSLIAIALPRIAKAEPIS